MGGEKLVMKLVFIPRRRLILTAMIICLMVVFLSSGIVYRNSLTATSDNIIEPIYQGKTGQKVVAITVNVDWGEEFIPVMLEEFKKHDATVSFFVTGRWAEKNPELLKQMASNGHSIQNHGYKHCHFNQLSADKIKSEIKKADDIIYKISGQRTNCFASPYGEFEKKLVRAVSEIDYSFIMWSVDTVDWKRPDPDTIVKRVMNKVHNDAIILMHPTDPTVKALPALLKQLEEENYQMISINEILLEGDKTSNSNE